MARFPETRRDDTVEVLHGRSIADPYRWLEDPDSAETADWVKRQNEFTARYLESLPDRAWFLDTMERVMRQPRAGVPFKRAGHYFVSRNDGRQNQDVIFVAVVAAGAAGRRASAGGPQHVLTRRHQFPEHLDG